jgi:molecular chaperone DnaK (HSP70)
VFAEVGQMTFEIILAPEEEAQLRERAAAAHLDVPTFVRAAVLEKLHRPTFEELLAPIHAATQKAGLTEADIDELVERGREEYWREKQSRPG